MPAGRPKKYNSPEEMQAIIDNYFETDAYIGEGENRMFAPTVEGLSYALDLDRKSLLNYQNDDAFFHTIKKAKQKVAIALEQRLYGQAVTGIIFNLKNNFEWKDKQEVESNITLDLSQQTDAQLQAIINGNGS